VNIKVVLEYDGANFAGWQQQRRVVLPIYGEVSPKATEGPRTVEAELKRALRSIVGEEVAVYGAGRTDAGAHAEGQVANFHTDGRIAPQRLMAGLNARLPDDVEVLSS
jgi:tRNA pseudouridine38-40 synthase